MTTKPDGLQPIIISDEICNRADCQLCEELNKLGSLIKERGEYTIQLRNQMFRCFCH